MYPHLNVFSLGCVGSLQQLLSRTYSTAIIYDEPTITLKSLKKHAMSQRDINTISREIHEGEGRLQSMRGKLSDVYLNLGIPSAHLPDELTWD